MAENESLDLGNPHAQRWKAVYDAVRKQQPIEQVAKQASEKLHKGLRKALKQLAEKGASLETLLANRNSPQTIRRLVRQAAGHDYALLFEQTAIVNQDHGIETLLDSLVGGVWDTISDQIAQNVAGTDRWTSLVDLQIFLNEVRHQIEPDVRRIAQKLASDPNWMPTVKPDTSSTKADPTAEMMSMSMLGMKEP